MPIQVALPIAHETGAADYTGYYDGAQSIFEVVDYFGQGTSEGLQLRANPAAPAPLADRQWDLYALTHGFLSMHGDRTLALRLPRELNVAPANAFNAGPQFLRLQPTGPQLRHVLYVFDVAPGADVETAVRTTLADAAHPGQAITRVANPAGGTMTLQAFLAAAAGNLGLVAQAFMNGNAQIFVRAGDVVGNFRAHTVDLRLLDSCGGMNSALGVTSPVAPSGRAINPSYYLYIVLTAGNAAEVTMLTSLVAAPAGLNQTHPLDHLLSAAVVAANGGEADHALDHTAVSPPKPLLITVPVQDAAGNPIAGRGIPADTLGDWHESRNAANPFATNAPVQWRYVGTQAGDVNRGEWGKFRSEVKAGMANWLPGGAAFNHNYPPTVDDSNRVSTYWDRYSQIFALVADAFEIPCEILVAIACKETAGGPWYNAGNFANSHEMDVIRMEPLNANPNTISPNPVQQARLTNFLNLAGGVAGVVGAPHANGANAQIPVPWNGGAVVQAGNPLTWSDLRQLINDFPRNVRVSPGVMQTLVSTARDDMPWLEEIVGAGSIHALSIVSNLIPLVADAPPPARGNLFSDWFGVSVDAAGANTNVAANVDAGLTQMKRAFHDIIAGASHVKRIYNSVAGSGAHRYNLLCDFDFPTVASGYNDAAADVPAAAPGANDATKWLRLFALRYYGGEYPQIGTRLFNAAVTLFNALPAGQRQPTVRIWRR